MRNNARDIFKRLFGIKHIKSKPTVTKVPTADKGNLFQRKKATHSRCAQHNQFQAMQANKIQKRRKANKVASKQRKVNRAA